MSQRIHSNRSHALLAALVTGFVGAAAPAQGQVINEDLKLLASDGAAFDNFGVSIAIDSGVVAVGAQFNEANGTRSGSAYLLDASTGAQIAKLVAIDGAVSDLFGQSIAIDNGVVAVGAWLDDDSGTDSGSAYLFDASTGAQIAKLLPTDGAAGDQFGSSIAIDNGIVVVGADSVGSYSGSTYLFDASSGVQIHKLRPTDLYASSFFGGSIAIDNGVVAVGARGDRDLDGNHPYVPGSGAAYLFNAATGAQMAKLLPGDGTRGDQFGFSIAIDNGIVAIGAPQDDDHGSGSGSAYLFNASTGTQIAKLTPGDGASGDNFGVSIAIDNGVVAVGAFYDDDNGFDAGSAYLFDASTGAQIAKLLSSDGGVIDLFGQSIAIDNGVAAVGAIWDNDNGERSGSAYLFDASSSAATPATLTSVERTLGLHIAGGVLELLASDDTYYILQSGPGFDPSEPHPARANFRFDSAGFPASTLNITLEEKANIGGPTAVVLLRNRVNSAWDEIARHGLSPTDQTFEMTGIPAAEYISATNGRITVRVRTFAILILNPTIRGIFSHDFVGVSMRE